MALAPKLETIIGKTKSNQDLVDFISINGIKTYGITKQAGPEGILIIGFYDISDIKNKKYLFIRVEVDSIELSRNVERLFKDGKKENKILNFGDSKDELKKLLQSYNIKFIESKESTDSSHIDEIKELYNEVLNNTQSNLVQKFEEVEEIAMLIQGKTFRQNVTLFNPHNKAHLANEIKSSTYKNLSDFDNGYRGNWSEEGLAGARGVVAMGSVAVVRAPFAGPQIMATVPVLIGSYFMWGFTPFIYAGMGVGGAIGTVAGLMGADFIYKKAKQIIEYSKYRKSVQEDVKKNVITTSDVKFLTNPKALIESVKEIYYNISLLKNIKNSFSEMLFNNLDLGSTFDFDTRKLTQSIDVVVDHIEDLRENIVLLSTLDYSKDSLKEEFTEMQKVYNKLLTRIKKIEEYTKELIEETKKSADYMKYLAPNFDAKLKTLSTQEKDLEESVQNLNALTKFSENNSKIADTRKSLVNKLNKTLFLKFMISGDYLVNKNKLLGTKLLKYKEDLISKMNEVIVLQEKIGYELSTKYNGPSKGDVKEIVSMID